jgi:hypothetical protein
MVCPGPQGLSIRCRIAGNAESDYELGLQSKRGAQMQTERLQQEDLKKIWSTIRKDRYGARALAILKRDGFDLVRIPVESRTWPGMIASIPFLPNLRARSRLLPRPQYLRLSIGFLRELSRSLASPHCHVEAYDPRERIIYMKPSNEMSPPSLHGGSKLSGKDAFLEMGDSGTQPSSTCNCFPPLGNKMAHEKASRQRVG